MIAWKKWPGRLNSPAAGVTEGKGLRYLMGNNPLKSLPAFRLGLVILWLLTSSRRPGAAPGDVRESINDTIDL
jgi:hypothetical protein